MCSLHKATGGVFVIGYRSGDSSCSQAFMVPCSSTSWLHFLLLLLRFSRGLLSFESEGSQNARRELLLDMKFKCATKELKCCEAYVCWMESGF